MTHKTYTVLNPRNIAPGVRIIAGKYGAQDHEWFEGDMLIPPFGMTDEDVQWLLDNGLIEEVTNG